MTMIIPVWVLKHHRGKAAATKDYLVPMLLMNWRSGVDSFWTHYMSHQWKEAVDKGSIQLSFLAPSATKEDHQFEMQMHFDTSEENPSILHNVFYIKTSFHLHLAPVAWVFNKETVARSNYIEHMQTSGHPKPNSWRSMPRPDLLLFLVWRWLNDAKKQSILLTCVFLFMVWLLFTYMYYERCM